MTLRQEGGEGIKYEVRSTKYEVKELGATELRGHGEGKQSRNDAWELNPCTREVGTHVAGGYMRDTRVAPLFITNDTFGYSCGDPTLLITHVFPARPDCLPHSPLLGFATSYFVLRTSYLVLLVGRL